MTKEEVAAQTHTRSSWLIPIPGTSAPNATRARLPRTRPLADEIALRHRARSRTRSITGTFLVQHKDVRQKKSGEPYLSLTLADRTGELDAKMWDNAAEALDTFERDDFVRVKGLLQIFQNRPQLTVHKIAPVAESEVDFADYFPASKRDRDEMFRELQAWIAGIGNPHLEGAARSDLRGRGRSLLAYRTAPAAKSVHHAWLGGLIEHVLSLCHLAKFTAAHYPDIDFDLLLAGVILHDIGKIQRAHLRARIRLHHRRPIAGPHRHRRADGGRQTAPDSGFSRAAARPAAAHDPEPSWRAGIRIAQSADVRRGDAAASSGQSGFEDGVHARGGRDGTGWWKASGPATAPRSIAAC